MTSNRRQIIQKDFAFSRNLLNLGKDSLSPTSTNDSQSPRDHCDKFANGYIK